jgi:hypothetical protein
MFEIENPPLGPNEVAVTPQQFAELARIAERVQVGAMSVGEGDTAMLAICPKLQKYRENKIVVETDVNHAMREAGFR